MAGAVSIVSRNEPYDLWLKNDMPCLTAGTSTEFLKAAQWCVKHRDELKTIARQAKDYVLAERTTKEQHRPLANRHRRLVDTCPKVTEDEWLKTRLHVVPRWTFLMVV